ncbi:MULTISPECIES: DUF4383 domain-containing protein [unclassified Micromonospora]|uniref:DUF4383 domain-containing protein n=1 Tax=unclassified Micromonospora TaxID=2617518 RepID=UPI00188DF248|nr:MULTISPECIES: DUF4383 domain-containing protein [unclassified Micromonospora]MBF5032716.1 DUF4383 domain-containing protein [Micromonospora sp. ANENR4]MCZ7477030.1 DUF4383 domain-containing protein [Micromonospora sp. WMMC273]WBC06488.1 DUF4383 domain-containing protein [Micromonospora sp. WMMA1976]
MREHATARPAVQKVALAAAALFALIGVLGFIPGITTHYGELTFAGHHSEAKLLGVFQVSVLHNLVHLLFGLVGLVMARRLAGARVFLAGGGALYLVLWLYGFAIDRDTAANFVPVNDADNWLHLVLGFGMLAAGLLLNNSLGTGTRVEAPFDRP